MEVEGYCKNCSELINAHWDKGVSVMDPKCPICKNDLYTWTDETLEHESPTGDDYDDTDE